MCISICAVKMFGANISKSSKLNIDTQKINRNGEEAFRYLLIVRTFYHLWVFNSKNWFPVKNIFNIYDFHKLTNVYKHIHALLSINKRTSRDFFLFFFYVKHGQQFTMKIPVTSILIENCVQNLLKIHKEKKFEQRDVLLRHGNIKEF